MKNDVRKLTDGAMMAAIIGAVLLIDRQTAGFLQGTLLFLFPLPLVFYGAKYGWKNSWAVFTAVVLLAWVIEGSPAGAILIACEALIGMVYGCGIYHRTDARKLVLRTIAVSLCAQVLTSLVFAQFFGMDLSAEAAELKDMTTQMMSAMNQEIPAGFNIDQMIIAVMITAVILTGILNALLLHVFSRLMFKRMHISVPPSTPISMYQPPKWSGYLGIGLAVCFYYASMQNMSNSFLQMSMEGAGLCGVMYLALYGAVAIVLFGQMRMHSDRFLSVLLAVILTMLGSVFVALLGFLYITTDMHQRMMQGGFKNERQD